METSVGEAQSVVDGVFADKVPSPPYFFITYGPPGSGKSEIVGKVLAKRQLTPDRVVRVLVDEIVEALPSYQAEMWLAEEEARARGLRGVDEATAQRIYLAHRYGAADAISEAAVDRAVLGS